MIVTEPSPSQPTGGHVQVFCAGWMIGTFVLFLVFGDTADLPSPLLLVTFILFATGSWVLGYRWGIRTFPTHEVAALHDTTGRSLVPQSHQVRRWVLASGAYFAIYGLLLLEAYGATSDSFLQAALTPGESYAAKFAIVETLSRRSGQTALQILILLSIFQLALAPLLVYFWSDLRPYHRLVAIGGAAVYSAFYLYIGTMQGLGFLLVGFFAGALARPRSSKTPASGTAEPRRHARRWISLAAVGIAFGLYMINAQAARLDTFDVTARFEPNPILEGIAGRDFARGAAVLAHYPTHGYRGLAYNLESPFVWTEGRGSSRAVDSYWEQYLGDSVLHDTYPLRTEKSSGWPGLQSWGTVYPWIASDITFPGTIVLMLFIGRWTARMWIRSTRLHDPLALMLFSQLILFVVFIPANNQVLISRPALIAVSSCLLLYFVRAIRRQFRKPELVSRSMIPLSNPAGHLRPSHRPQGSLSTGTRTVAADKCRDSDACHTRAVRPNF